MGAVALEDLVLLQISLFMGRGNGAVARARHRQA